MSDRWLSREEVLAATGWSSRVLQRRTACGDIEARPVMKVRKRNGRPAFEYRFESLPFAVQTKIIEKEKNATALIVAPVNSDASIEPAKVALSAEEEEQARTRYNFIEPLLRFENEQRFSKNEQLALTLGLKLPDGTPVDSLGKMRKYLAQLHQVGSVSLWRWFTRYKKHGLIGLADRARSDKGKSHFRASYPKAAAVAASLYLDQRKMGIKGIHRLICQQHAAFDIPEDDLPSYSALRAWLLTTPEMTPAMRILARDGLRSYENRVSPYLQRAYADVFANQVWCSDHKICDVEVWNDCFLGLRLGTPMRLRFTGIMDFRSRKMVGWAFAPEGSSMSIVTAMRPALVEHGPPEVLYVDNGTDYRKVGREVCPRVGIHPQYCQPYHGQAKPIERQWRTMKEQLEILFTTYTGGKPELRPDATVVRMAWHRKLLQAGTPELSEHPPASYFICMAAAWIDDYNSTPHSGKGMHGASPNEVFQANPNPRQRPPLQPTELVQTLAERSTRKVHECAVEINKLRYIGVDEAAARVLHDLAEEDVLVAYDPNDCEGVAVLDVGGFFLCWAKPEQLQPHSAASSEAVAQMMQMRRRMRRQTEEAITGIHQLAAKSGAATGLEMLEKKAMAMPIAIGDHLTQRRIRVRPDERAVAPPSAGEIMRGILDMEDK